MPNRAIVFCGVDEGKGRDWICAQTAELLATIKQSSICIVDANVTNPSLHTYFGVENNLGLSAALVEIGPVMDFTQPTGREHLRLMNAGEPSLGLNSGPGLASARLAARIRELRANFDYVLMNAPPATRDSVTGYLGAMADGVVLIIEPSFTPRQATREIKEEIEAAGAGGARRRPAQASAFLVGHNQFRSIEIGTRPDTLAATPNIQILNLVNQVTLRCERGHCAAIYSHGSLQAL